jgi:monoamine oxidase
MASTSNGLSRRSLLGGLAAGGAVGAVGGLTGGLAAGPAEAATLQGRLPRAVDVVVVGGGISGLVAARRLSNAGR